MKKLLTILFGSLVIFSLAMPVFADESAPATTTKSKSKKSKAPKSKKSKTEDTSKSQ